MEVTELADKIMATLGVNGLTEVWREWASLRMRTIVSFYDHQRAIHFTCWWDGRSLTPVSAREFTQSLHSKHPSIRRLSMRVK